MNFIKKILIDVVKGLSIGLACGAAGWIIGEVILFVSGWMI